MTPDTKAGGPMISVIVPVLNEAAGIESMLKNLLNLIGHFEILVVDGGSTDGTVEMARPYSLVLVGERGRAAQMNLGAYHAKGKILLFLHADTALPAGALQQIEKALDDPDVVGGRFRLNFDSPKLIFRLVERAINLRDRLFGGFTGDQAIFVRAGAFRALGGYLTIPLMEDLDLGARMTRLGKVARLPVAASTSARRWERNGVFRTIFLMWCLRFSYLLGLPPEFLSRLYANVR